VDTDLASEAQALIQDYFAQLQPTAELDKSQKAMYELTQEVLLEKNIQGGAGHVSLSQHGACRESLSRAEQSAEVAPHKHPVGIDHKLHPALRKQNA